MNVNFFGLDGSEVQPLSPDDKADNIASLQSGLFSVLNPEWTTAFSEIKDSLRTGDIILVHGRYPFSWVVELLQWSGWGHSAMVILAKDLDPENKFGLPPIMLWESNTGDQEVPNLWDEPKAVKAGPMLIDLEARLKHSQGSYKDVKIVHRPLFNCPPIDHLALQDYFTSQIGKGFPSDKDVIYSVYIGRKYNRPATVQNPEIGFFFNPLAGGVTQVAVDRGVDAFGGDEPLLVNEIYCSELLAGTYKQMGLLTNTWVNNAYSPKDFSVDGTMRLLRRAWLGEQMYLNMFQ